MSKKLMLVSNSYCFGQSYLEHCLMAIQEFLGPAKSILWIGYAQGNNESSAFTTAEKAFMSIGVQAFRASSGISVLPQIDGAEAIFVAGGNTFVLLQKLYDFGGAHIESCVKKGTPYIGTSAGAVIAGPTIKTTNDMPIVFPPSFDALGLVPFQINAHYFDPDPNSKHMGETREKRIQEFHEFNPQTVVGLREGAWISVEHKLLQLRGNGGAKLFEKGKQPIEWPIGVALTSSSTGLGPIRLYG